MRVEADRRTVSLPVIGPLRSKENTRRLERLVRVGRAKVLSATLSERWGRLFVSFACIVQKHEHAPAHKKRAGVDLGLRCLNPDEGCGMSVHLLLALRATQPQRKSDASQTKLMGS
jgi:transposase